MEQYGYLFLAVAVMACALLCIVVRPDLRRLWIKIGVVGGVLGLFSELLYFKDYWAPPSTSGIAVLSVEDFFFGFGVLALAACIYKVCFGFHFVEGQYPSRRRTVGVLFLIGVILLVVFNLGLGVNSILVSTAVFVFCSFVMLLQRPDLWRASIGSAALLTLVITPIYLALDALMPNYIETYWLLAGTVLDVRLIGIPLTEFAWYLSTGSFAGIVYEFATGRGLRKLSVGDGGLEPPAYPV